MSSLVFYIVLTVRKHHADSTVALLSVQDQSTTVGVFFEIMTSKKQDSAGLADGAAGQTFYLQFITKYLNGQTGRTHCRVTTITRQCVSATLYLTCCLLQSLWSSPPSRLCQVLLHKHGLWLQILRHYNDSLQWIASLDVVKLPGSRHIAATKRAQMMTLS